MAGACTCAQCVSGARAGRAYDLKGEAFFTPGDVAAFALQSVAPVCRRRLWEKPPSSLELEARHGWSGSPHGCALCSAIPKPQSPDPVCRRSPRRKSARSRASLSSSENTSGFREGPPPPRSAESMTPGARLSGRRAGLPRTGLGPALPRARLGQLPRLPSRPACLARHLGLGCRIQPRDPLSCFFFSAANPFPFSKFKFCFEFQ
jgi:hypothetical protein